VTGVLKVPEWPFALAAGFCIVLFALALAANLATALADTVRLRDARAGAIGLAWILAAAAILWMILWPQDLPVAIPRELRGVRCTALGFLLIVLGVDVAAAMAITALMGISLLINADASLTSLATTPLDVVGDQTWSVIPLFTWMGLIVVAAGFAE